MAYGDSFWGDAPQVATPTVPTVAPQNYGSDFWNGGAKPSGARVATIPSWLGGGAYNIGPDISKVINTGHTNYAGLPSKPGFQRNDIVPVGLGGNNSDRNNVAYQPLAQAQAQDPIEKQAISDYQNGHLTLPQARLKIMTVRQQAENPIPGQCLVNNFRIRDNDHIDYLKEKYEAEEISVDFVINVNGFLRIITKIAYCMTVWRYGLNSIGENFVLPAILSGENIDRWVGSDGKQEIGELAKDWQTDHIVLTGHTSDGELTARIKLFKNAPTPEYIVIVGQMKEATHALFQSLGHV
jgi:hypothetical protein